MKSVPKLSIIYFLEQNYPFGVFMNIRKIFFVTMLFFTAPFLCCESISPQTINEAKAAIENAKSCGALLFCQEQFHSAQRSYDSAVAEIEKQSKNKRSDRTYAKAMEYLQRSINNATVAFNETLMKKEKLRSETIRSISTANGFLDSTENLITQSKKSKRTISGIQANIDSLKSSLGTVDSLLVHDELVKAQGNAESVVIQSKILHLKTISLLHLQKKPVKS
jgi:hypothetical protein